MSRTPERMTFWFDAAACSGCKACQIACKDRNGLETGRLWRRVPEIAGGGWQPDGTAWRHSVFAYHLSMSCNHCARPICLEGCPTRAITARADGVVQLDENRCMGCGYCSWVCPYSAPQLDAARGCMSKCTFCAEDLDAGLEPACVAACPVRALDAGLPSQLAARHGGTNGGEDGADRTAAAEIAPLPSAALTEPALQIVPHADAPRSVEPDAELTPRPARGLREWSLVVFTVLSQAAAGMTLWAGLMRVALDSPADRVLLPVAAVLMIAALIASALHLGRPRNALRAASNAGASWLSREIVLALVFLGSTAAAGLAGSATLAWVAAAAAVAYLAGMAKVYMQRTVPVWNTWRTPAGFAGTALLLGGLLDWALVLGGRDGAPAWLAPLAWGLTAAAFAHQILRRRRFYARYERLGV